jgi:two-component system response regulator LytT
MKILLIEDEEPAARRLTRMVQKVQPQAQILGQLESVEEALEWWSQNESPDLVLLDIHLADGSAFEFLEKAGIRCPVIFTTAYDAYALQAFEHNSVDYLLKPIREEALQTALDKYQELFGQSEPVVSPIDYALLARSIRQGQKEYPKRLLIRFAQQLKAIEISDVAYFYIEERVCFLRTHEGKRYPIDQTLDQLEEMLNPAQFFRLNRQLITNIAAIHKMHTWSKSRIKVEMKPPAPVETTVSSEKSAAFKAWLKGIDA